jgi:2TM domain
MAEVDPDQEAALRRLSLAILLGKTDDGPSSWPAHHRPDVATLPLFGPVAPEPMGHPALPTKLRWLHPEGAGVARGMGKELSEMPEVTLEDYKRVDRQWERQRARRGFTIHAIAYAVVLAGLIILSLTLGDVFPWAGLPMALWGVGLTLHYLYGVRWVDKTISGRQAQIEQRAAAGKRAA